MRKSLRIASILVLAMLAPLSAQADGRRFVVRDPYGCDVLVDEEGDVYTPQGVYEYIRSVTAGECAPEEQMFAARRLVIGQGERRGLGVFLGMGGGDGEGFLMNAFGEEVAPLSVYVYGGGHDPASGQIVFQDGSSIGVMDENGDVLVEPLFAEAEFDGEGGFLATLPRRALGFLSGDDCWGWRMHLVRHAADGSRADTGLYALDLNEFLEGLAPVRGENGLWGLVRADGTLLLPFEYDGFAGFAAGDAVLLVYRDDCRTAQLIDRRTLAVVAELQSEHGYNVRSYMTWQEGRVAPGIFSLEELHGGEGDAAAVVIDAAGNVLFRAEGAEVTPYGEERIETPEVLALQEGTGKDFFVDLSGRRVGAVHDGIAPHVGPDGAARFIVWDREYGEGTKYNDRLYGVVDSAGAEIIAQAYDGLEYVGGGLYKFEDGDLYGILGDGGAEILPARYKRLQSLGDGLFNARLGDRWGLLGLDGNWRVSFSDYEVLVD